MSAGDHLNPSEFYHVTDNPDFQLDPEFTPSDVYAEQAGQPLEKGLFVTDTPERWRSRDRSKFVAEIDVDPSSLERYDGYLREWFIPGDRLSKASVKNIRPFKAE